MKKIILFMMKKIILFMVLSIFYFSATAQVGGYAVGETVDDFTVTTIEGESINLYSITALGKYVFIDFFFVSCVPCQETAPKFNEFYDKYGCNMFDVYCMSMDAGDDSDSQVEAYESSFGGSFEHCPIISGDGGSASVTEAFTIGAFPTICIIGPANKLINGDIWPVADYTVFADALSSAGSSSEEMACTISSVDEVVQDNTLDIFPNPTSDFITIAINTTDEQLVVITNVIGQEVYRGITQGGRDLQISVEDLENGIYLVKSKNLANNNVFSSKLQVAK